MVSWTSELLSGWPPVLPNSNFRLCEWWYLSSPSPSPHPPYQQSPVPPRLYCHLLGLGLHFHSHLHLYLHRNPHLNPNPQSHTLKFFSLYVEIGQECPMYSVPNLAFWLAMENVSSSLSWSWVQQTELFLFLHSENVPRSLTIEAPKNLKSPSDWSSCPSYQLCSHVKSRNSITLNSQKSVTAKKDDQVYLTPKSTGCPRKKR